MYVNKNDKVPCVRFDLKEVRAGNAIAPIALVCLVADLVPVLCSFGCTLPLAGCLARRST